MSRRMRRPRTAACIKRTAARDLKKANRSMAQRYEEASQAATHFMATQRRRQARPRAKAANVTAAATRRARQGWYHARTVVPRYHACTAMALERVRVKARR